MQAAPHTLRNAITTASGGTSSGRGELAFTDTAPTQLALPLAFAGGAVLASVIDTLAPEAFRDGGPSVALASGFFTAFVLSG